MTLPDEPSPARAPTPRPSDADAGADVVPLPRSPFALRVLLAAGALALLYAFGTEAAAHLQSFAAWVETLGAWAPLAFVAGYALAVAALVPGSLLTLAGGAIFGLAWGTLYVFVAAVAGSVAGFLIARYAARGFVERRVAADARFAAIDRAVARSGFQIVLLLRMSPVFPFSLLNYALGLTRVRLRDYAFASVGMLPGTLLYVYYGKAIGDVAAIASGAPRDGAGSLWVTVLGLAATIAVTVQVTRIARRALSDATHGEVGAQAGAPEGGEN